MSVYSPMHPSNSPAGRCDHFSSVFQYNTVSMKQLRTNMNLFTETFVRSQITIFPIPDDRMTDGRKMCTDLVGSAGNKMDFKFRISIQKLPPGGIPFQLADNLLFPPGGYGKQLSPYCSVHLWTGSLSNAFFRAALLLQYNGNISGQYVF